MKKASLLALGVSMIALTAAHADDATKIEKVTVTGAGGSTGSGYAIPEDATKERSTVTKEGIGNKPATSSPYQQIDVLPGVNGQSQDATGLFGGAITMRGFSDQELGFTIDGAPVNDSGNFAVFPQEYVDPENLEQIFVTQGSTDFDAPHVGATGGNIGIVSSNPVDYTRYRFTQTLGELGTTKTFMRFDSGNFDGFSSYVSFSHAEADKFKGEGEANRDHVDGKLLYRTDGGSQYSAAVVWNRAINNFFRRLSLDDIDQLGIDYDYAATLSARPAPVNGTVQNESLCGGVACTGGQTFAGVANPNNSNLGRRAFYDLQINPFENAISNVKANMQLTNNLRLDIEPYLWIGKGGGAFGVTVAEGNPRTVASGPNSSTTDANCGATSATQPFASIDLNGDGDTKDCILAYRNSTTETYRPGVNMRLTETFDNYKLVVGGWYERARHIQRQPFTLVDANGQPLDQWSENHNIVVTVLATGKPYTLEGRDQHTVSTGYEVFGNLTGEYFEDTLKLNVGVRAPTLERDFSYVDLAASTNVTGLVNRNFQGTYSEILPNVGVSYQVAPEHIFFADAAKNMKAPPNFIFSDSGNGLDVKEETSWNFEAGYRYQSPVIVASLTGFAINFKDRLLSSFDPAVGANRTFNIGDVDQHGAEFEVGTAPWHGLTLYTSASWIDTELQNDYRTSVKRCANATCSAVDAAAAVVLLPTKGTQMVDTPEFMLAASVGWQYDGFFIGVTPKYRAKQYSTMVNDEFTDGYTLVDATAGYRFPDASFFHNMKLQLFVNNVFNQDYLFSQNSTGLNANMVAPVGSGLDCSSTSANMTGCVPAAQFPPSYYAGGDRLVTMSLAFDLN